MSEEGEMVAGDDYISDESSFYGDEAEQERLELLCENFDTNIYWRTRHQDLNVKVAKARLAAPMDLHNPLEGEPRAWQSHESVSDFLQRLPPSTTAQATIGPWIFVANPHRHGQDRAGRSRIRELEKKGADLLEQSLQKRAEIGAQTGKTSAAIRRELNQESKLLKDRIEQLAEETNVLSGKWMLFPTPTDVNRMWRSITQAVIDNRLGTRAKVATDGGAPGSRLICVYTKDFRDADNILRVLRELFSMGLVKEKARQGIYYKADVYTYLGIYHQNANEYGLQASQYSSNNMLASVYTHSGSISRGGEPDLMDLS